MILSIISNCNSVGRDKNTKTIISIGLCLISSLLQYQSGLGYVVVDGFEVGKVCCLRLKKITSDTGEEDRLRV